MNTTLWLIQGILALAFTLSGIIILLNKDRLRSRLSWFDQYSPQMGIQGCARDNLIPGTIPVRCILSVLDPKIILKFKKMTYHFKTVFMAIIALTSLFTNKLHAQSVKSEDKTTFAIETDPSTFAFNGYAFHFRIKPKNSRHLLIGAGTYALDLPKQIVDLDSKNKQQAWKVRISSAYSLFGDYYLKEPNQKWYIGLQTGVQNYRNTNDNLPGRTSKYSNLLIMPSIGYSWHPFNIPFYIKPWAGIGYTTKISGDNRVGNLTYDISPLLPFITLHIGYTF
jgi:hypothetical protein